MQYTLAQTKVSGRVFSRPARYLFGESWLIGYNIMQRFAYYLAVTRERLGSSGIRVDFRCCWIGKEWNIKRLLVNEGEREKKTKVKRGKGHDEKNLTRRT